MIILACTVLLLLLYCLHTGIGASSEEQVVFSGSMSEEDFFKWLRSKGVSDKDCKTLSGKMPQCNCIVLLLFIDDVNCLQRMVLLL